MRQTVTAKPKPPSLWVVVVLLLVSVGALVDAGVTVFGGDCASLEIPPSTFYHVVGKVMRSICERWGPLLPAAFEVLGAVIAAVFAVALWRERRRAAP